VASSTRHPPVSTKIGHWPQSAFWDFSVHLYEKPGVEAACLALQERHGLDVNLLLWGLWLADCGVMLEQSDLERAKAATGTWQSVIVGPLRDIRRQLRHGLDLEEPKTMTGEWPDQSDALRRSVLKLELDGEHLAQLALGRIGDALKPSHRSGPALAGANLTHLAAFEESDRGDLANLLKQTFPDAYQMHLDAAVDDIFNTV